MADNTGKSKQTISIADDLLARARVAAAPMRLSFQKFAVLAIQTLADSKIGSGPIPAGTEVESIPEDDLDAGNDDDAALGRAFEAWVAHKIKAGEGRVPSAILEEVREFAARMR